MEKPRLNIGNLSFEYGLLLAPMAGFSDRAMRLVCKKYGAEFSVSEMVSAKAVVYRDRKTARLAKIEPDESPSAVQLFGSERDIMGEAASIVCSGEFGGAMPSMIDINMGCPVPKIFKNNEGSALMKEPKKIEEIVKATVNGASVPVGVKLRLGIDESSVNVLECALAAECGGASLVTVHGRTRAAQYSGEARYGEIAEVKRALKIPVIANGDIADAEKAIFVIKETGADGIMIGRGAIGNPFIFKEIRAALDGKEYPLPSIKDRVETALLQLRLAILDKGEDIAVREARGQIAQYVRSFRGAAGLRGEINRAKSYCEVEAAMLRVIEINEEQL
jgi:nifR3 family TIM-barrel protein